jgi:outer membrane biosynthesis protein TonB
MPHPVTTQRPRGLKYSAILHLVLLGLAVLGLPHWFAHNEPMPPPAMTVEILPFSAVSNVKPHEAAPKPKPQPKKEQTRKPVQEAHHAAPKPSEAVPAPPKPKPLPKQEAKPVEKPKPKPKPKPAPKKQVEKKEKASDDALDKILQSVKDTEKSQESKKTQKAEAEDKTVAKSEHYDASKPLSISEEDAIRSQFVKCWNVPAGAKDAKDLIVTLHITLSADGTVTAVTLAKDQGRYASDTFFRAAADSAMRAVHICSPLQHLPPDKYGAWRDMELTFDPSEML